MDTLLKRLQRTASLNIITDKQQIDKSLPTTSGLPSVLLRGGASGGVNSNDFSSKFTVCGSNNR